jgi:hypothetical protein
MTWSIKMMTLEVTLRMMRMKRKMKMMNLLMASILTKVLPFSVSLERIDEDIQQLLIELNDTAI